MVSMNVFHVVPPPFSCVPFLPPVSVRVCGRVWRKCIQRLTGRVRHSRGTVPSSRSNQQQVRGGRRQEAGRSIVRKWCVCALSCGVCARVGVVVFVVSRVVVGRVSGACISRLGQDRTLTQTPLTRCCTHLTRLSHRASSVHRLQPWRTSRLSFSTMERGECSSSSGAAREQQSTPVRGLRASTHRTMTTPTRLD